MKTRTNLMLAVVAGLVIPAMFAQGPATVTGSWEAKGWDEKLHLQLDLDNVRGRWNMGFTVPWSDVRGISATTFSEEGEQVRFELARDAGVTTFEGRVHDKRASGDFQIGRAHV